MLKDSCKHPTVLFVSSRQDYNFLARLLHMERLRRDSRNTKLKFIIIPKRPRMLNSVRITLRRSKGLPRQLRNDWNWVTNGQDQKGHVDARDIESTHGAEISTTPWGHLWRAEQSVGSPWCQNMRSNSELQRIFIWNEDPQSLSYDVTSVLKWLHVFCFGLTFIIYPSAKAPCKLLGQALWSLSLMLRSDSKGLLQRHSLGAGGPKRHQFCRVLLQASIRVCVPNGNTPGMSKMYLPIVSTQRIWYFHSNILRASRTYERRVQKLLRFCCRRPKQRPSEQHGHNGRSESSNSKPWSSAAAREAE